ncbi:hypothetical protein ACFZCG_34350 [Streptomyces tanashiensis]|uniref:hypothetical protein n=1 Tax=Streptomyces tanashiensis TaxID=67367 RepID=UPI0036E9E743
MPETEAREFEGFTFWPYVDEDLRRVLHELAREARFCITPPDLRPALTTFHDPEGHGTGLLTLLAQVLRELSGNLNEKTPHHEAVREALDAAADHITDTAGRHIADAIALLTPPDQR